MKRSKEYIRKELYGLLLQLEVEDLTTRESELMYELLFRDEVCKDVYNPIWQVIPVYGRILQRRKAC